MGIALLIDEQVGRCLGVEIDADEGAGAVLADIGLAVGLIDKFEVGDVAPYAGGLHHEILQLAGAVPEADRDGVGGPGEIAPHHEARRLQRACRHACRFRRHDLLVERGGSPLDLRPRLEDGQWIGGIMRKGRSGKEQHGDC